MRQIERLRGEFSETNFWPVLESFLLDMETRNLTPKSIAGYFEHLGHLFRFIQGRGLGDPAAAGREDLQRYILSQRGKVSDHTVNTRLRHIRAFYNWMIREEILAASPMAKIRLLRADKGPKPVLPPESIKKLLSGLRGRKLRRFEADRNRAMIMVLWDGMVRLSELVGVELEDISVGQRLILIRGKGRKRRMVPLSQKTLKLTQRWQMMHRQGLPGSKLFCDRDGKDLQARNVRLILERLGNKYRIHVNPHLIRHSAATWYIKSGGSLERLRLILGHSSLIVTQNYLHLSAADLVEDFQDHSPANALGNV